MSIRHRHLTRRRPNPARQRSAEPHVAYKPSSEGILKLQRLIGNQAVQRMLVQRAPAENKGSTPSALATITLDSGEIQGTSRLKGHEGKIEISSLSTSVTKDGGVDVNILKAIDESTPYFAQAVSRGSAIESAKFEYLHRSEDDKVEVSHTIELKDGVIASEQIVSAGDEGQLESVSISFKEIGS